MLCVLMEALGIDIGKMTEQANARPQESGAPEPACPEKPAPPPADAAQPSPQLNYPPCMESSS